jgi:hypothetical protein
MLIMSTILEIYKNKSISFEYVVVLALLEIHYANTYKNRTFQQIVEECGLFVFS